MKLKVNFAVVLGVLMFSLPVVAQNLTVLAEDNPPFSTVKDGQTIGIAAELFAAIARKVGSSMTVADIRTQPWARAYDTAQNQKDTLLFPMARTAAREDLFKWVGPIYKVQIGLIGAKSENYSVPDAATASKYKIGTVRDGAPEQALVKAGVSEAILDRGTDLISNLKKLQAGRIDLFAFNAVAAAYNMSSVGMNPADYEVVFVLSEPMLYFAFNKETSDSTVKSFQSALDSLKADGSYDAIVKKYIK